MAAQYRVWLTVQNIEPNPQSLVGGTRTTFVIYEGSDRRYAKRLARNLGAMYVTNRRPHAAVVESGWEVIG